MSRARLALLSFALIALILSVAGGAPSGAASGPALAPHVPGELIIKFKPAARGLERAGAMAQINASHVRTFRSGAEHWKLGPGVKVEQAMSRMSRNPNVEYVEPDYIRTVEVIPNDPRFGELYGMTRIDADMAWGITRGSHGVVVAVIDTGVDHGHPDLAANMWRNPGEIPANGIDDDGNGFVDDVHGYDFVNNDGNPFDDNGHGTHCAGTIGAVGNNGIGVVGVNWDVSIMAVKFLSAGGSGSTTNAISSVEYATMMGADLTSNSWGGGGFSQALFEAIAEAGAAEIPFIAAAGNSGSNNDVGDHFPSDYDLVNVVAVAASDSNDAPASFTSYGATSVDLAAPGVNILSTQPGGGYQLLSGTSMATPHVAGAAALLKSRFPNIPAAQLKFALMNFVDPIPAFHPVTGTRPVASGGRLNVFFSIADPDEDPPGAIGDLAVPETGSNHAVLSWTATGDDGGEGTATSYQVRYSTSPIDESNFASATRAPGEPAPTPSGSPQTMEVRGLAASTMYHFALRALDEWGNAGPVSNVASAATQPPPTAFHDPNSIEDHLFTGARATHVVTLGNVGAGTLDFTIPTPAVSTPAAVHPALPLEKDEPDPRQGILGAGGPDASGYRWADSDQPGGPAFSWVEISGVGTPITSLDGDDEIANDIPIGFPFGFYDSTFSTVNVSTNGWLSFTNRTASGSITYANQPLPTTGGPENIVAPFWDDLNFRGAVHAYYHNDGGRFIVQWNDVDRHPAEPPDPDHLTFQVILHPDGSIVYQYLTTNGLLTSSTVGIQNGARNDGLTVAFNTTYLHDGLAVEFSRVPQWLTASPAAGRIGAGGSQPISVLLDAAGLEGGTYPGAVHILTNDPNGEDIAIGVTLHVTGAPDATVSPASIDFGDVFFGFPHERSLNVVNAGTDVLHVTAVTTSSPELSAAPGSFEVVPRAGQPVIITLMPAVLGPFSGSVTVHSDDASEPAIEVPVTANVIPAPVVAADPLSFEETLFSGNVVTRTLTVTNAGGSDLMVSAAADQGSSGQGITSTDPAIEGQGGPDAFGYRWRDSDAPGGPALQWVDIGATGTPISFSSLDDSLSATIPMGMSFPFYGNTFTSMKVSTNGWLTFDTTATASVAGNGTLPSTTLPRNSIALFWDDLHLRVAGRVRYLNDGTRLIVQYTNVDKFSPSGASLTFQVQLYPNGRILLQYLTMTGTLSSATIGVQDQTRTIALQVVANAAYMHNNLALQISRTPDWLRVSPAGHTVPPGESRAFDVVFDSTDRTGGTLTGAVLLTTNVPGEEQLDLPATLHVIGAPNVQTAPTSFNFGTVFAGFPQLTSFQVLNSGTAVLNVSDILTTDPSLTVEDQPGPTAGFTLAPGASRIMNLRWHPASPGPLAAHVQVVSDDPDSSTLSLPAVGNAIAAPAAQHSPASFSESLLSGQAVHRTLHLENHGGSDLTFAAALRALGGTPVPIHDELKLDKDEADPRPGILGSGGPDLFGYRWRDSDAAGGPVFDWVDITAVGTPIASLTLDDQVAVGIPIGFSFPFYGNTFGTVNVHTNGYMSFTSTTATGTFTNQALPSAGSGVPENMLAVFWDDMNFRGAVHAYYHNDGGRFIVQWNDVDRHPAGEPPTPDHLTFQAILHPNGRITFQYLTMDGRLDSATIGIQNATRNDGLTTVFNAAYMHDNLALEFRPPVDFLSVNPLGGTIPPAGSADLDVAIDAAGLIGGDYAAEIQLLTNDPARGLIPVPVSLHVTGIQDVDVQPAALVFPTTYVGFAASLPVTVRNTGTDVLTIGSIASSGAFTVNAPAMPVALPVNGTLPLTVVFTPPADGPHAGELTVSSDDPDEPVVTVPLQGDALIPPEASVAPAAISTALPPGGARTKTLTLGNTGGSDLVWSTGTNIISVVQPYPYVELEKDDVDQRAGILGSGGPDLFGYRWKDSDEPGGPAFDWTDISVIGTPIPSLAGGTTGGDDEIATIPIGFPFSFYGSTFTTVNVSTNGWLSFTSTLTRPGFTNQPLPNAGTGVPENLLAGFWDDLDFRDQAKARYHNDGSRLIVQYTGVDRFSTTQVGNVTFQVILYPNGKIRYQYLTMTGLVSDATIGIQNAMRNDGLTVVFNAAYVHDGLAVELAPIPDWVAAGPGSGVIPAGGSQEITLSLDAAGLEDGLHEATVEIESNDPYTPVLAVPIALNVGLVAPSYLHFDPEVFNLSANGHSVKMVIELPPAFDPHAVGVDSVTLNDTVTALSLPVEFTDENENGVEEIVVRFDRAAVEALLPEGDSVPVTVQGEVTDVQWFRGTSSVRTLRPRVHAPNGGEYLTEGQALPISWSAVQGGGVRYSVQLSRDGGTTWELLAEGLSTTAHSWTAGGAPTVRARIRVVASDNQGVIGYDTSDADFTVAGPLMPPHDVGETLEVFSDASDVILTWKRPAADAVHGPADRFRIFRSLSAEGPFTEIGQSTGESFRDPHAATQQAALVHYKVIASNAAGDASQQ
ncbi:MAG TPA: S8 family serine peptidase [Candidatus Polarisedimenticolia bacterium]|nr:S8 family serine peptidase [Candidatus Polarisedimenticolia bacterium]